MMFHHYLEIEGLLKRVLADPKGMEYRDLAITPPGLDELNLALYAETRGTAEEIEKKRHQDELIRAAQAKSTKADGADARRRRSRARRFRRYSRTTAVPDAETISIEPRSPTVS